MQIFKKKTQSKSQVNPKSRPGVKTRLALVLGWVDRSCTCRCNWYYVLRMYWYSLITLLQLSLQETTLRESFLSRDTYEEDLRKLEVGIVHQALLCCIQAVQVEWYSYMDKCIQIKVTVKSFHFVLYLIKYKCI